MESKSIKYKDLRGSERVEFMQKWSEYQTTILRKFQSKTLQNIQTKKNHLALIRKKRDAEKGLPWCAKQFDRKEEK